MMNISIIHRDIHCVSYAINLKRMWRKAWKQFVVTTPGIISHSRSMCVCVHSLRKTVLLLKRSITFVCETGCLVQMNIWKEFQFPNETGKHLCWCNTSIRERKRNEILQIKSTIAEGDQRNEHLEEINVQLSSSVLFFCLNQSKRKLEGSFSSDVSLSFVIILCRISKMELKEFDAFFHWSFDMSHFFFFFFFSFSQ